MSSTYNKLVRDATKPKPGAPKPKYIDPILAASFSQDGSLADVCKALSLRLRESSSLVVFKTLIILHTMIRNGAVDNVLSHLAADQAGFRLKNVSQGGNWQGYDAPATLPPYAAYLDERIRTFREIKHDVIRSADGSRSDTNRLRKLRVEKGLLREVAYAQRVLSRALDCPFFQDNLGDDLNVSAFRMVLKDILALYTAINEGVINILEHYFEMSHTDASRALDVYNRFCRHTEKVVAYLSAARKASHSLNMTVPQLKHAPVSLAGALKEYLDDANFEKNRSEYKENKRVADGADASGSSSSAPVRKVTEPSKASEPKKEEAKSEEKPTAAPAPKPPTSNQAIQDFFSTLESEMPGSSGGPGTNPYSMAPQATGMAWFGSPNPNMYGGGMQPQMTGYNPFLAPQATGAFGMGMGMGMQPTGAAFFGQPQPPQQQQTGFLQPQQTAMPGQMSPMQSQATGFNPFRQSMAFPGGMAPQATGMGPGGAFDATPYTVQVQQQMERQRMEKMQREQEAAEKAKENGGQNGEASGQQQQQQQQQQPPQQNNFLSPQATSAPAPAKILPQKTGSRNPFAPPPEERAPTPPTPKPQGPSLAQLAFSQGGGGGAGMNGPTQGGGGNYALGAGAWNGAGQHTGQQQPEQQQNGAAPSSSGLKPQATGLLGSVASEFTGAGRSAMGMGASNGVSSPQPPSSPGPSSATSSALSNGFSSLSLNSGGPGSTSFGSSLSPQTTSAHLSPQATGFGGSSVRPFQPSSSFGTTLAAQQTGMPPQSTSTPAAPSNNPFGMPQQQQQQQQMTGLPAQNTAMPFSFSSQSQPQQQQSTAGQLQPQSTATPFSFQQQQQQQQQQQPQSQMQPQATGFGGSTVKPFVPTSSFGLESFGGGQQQQNGQQNGQQQGQNVNLLQF
ncbi:ANTH-domain-containing protein [Jaminaea rosea]|uniref:ANTH-domain-containing protein n=1 Tax=Jaminaea rosea TaxID=1569628 RepID=A0A316UQU0_9BASI|nr:ANTH-domain-containing protein [Jaminaea rosea]PWN27662.1 ANTH-domain-containing protein [Jaminaea rosea]